MALPGWLAASSLDAASPEQVQPAGVDLRVGYVEEFVEPGLLGEAERVIPRGRMLEPEDGVWMLGPGAYRVGFADTVRVPAGAVGLCFPRSSLVRMGASLHCAVWDPGYRGRGQALLVVHNPRGVRLEAGARIAQLVYVSLRLFGGIYNGRYLGEGLG